MQLIKFFVGLQYLRCQRRHFEGSGVNDSRWDFWPVDWESNLWESRLVLSWLL